MNIISDFLNKHIYSEMPAVYFNSFIIIWIGIVIASLIYAKKNRIISSKKLKKENNQNVRILDFRDNKPENTSCIFHKTDFGFAEDYDRKLLKLFPKKDTPLVILHENYSFEGYLLRKHFKTLGYTDIRVLTDTKHIEKPLFK